MGGNDMMYDIVKEIIRKNPNLAHFLFRKSHNPDYPMPAESFVELVEMGFLDKGVIRANVADFVKKNLELNEQGELIMIS